MKHRRSIFCRAFYAGFVLATGLLFLNAGVSAQTNQNNYDTDASFAGTNPQRLQDKGVAHIPLPADLSGTLNGTEYKIRVPALWNGTLLVWAHGSMTTAIQISPDALPATSSTLEEQLLSAGYALAGSWYKDSLIEGPKQTLALTRFFGHAVGRPLRTLVWGMSLGGDVTLFLIENHPEVYDGAIPVAGVAGGWPNFADSLLRFDLAYAAAFGWPTDWWGPVENLRDDLYGNEATLIMPVYQWAWAGNYGQWEFIRLVMKESPKAWWETDFQGYALVGWAGTAVRSHLEQQYGGPVAQNIGAQYTLTDDEKSYLSTLGVNADQLLGWMNAHTNIGARRAARNRLAQYGAHNGNLHRPVVMMQGIDDPLVIASNAAVYHDLAEARRHENKLAQAYVNTWHGPYSAEQYLAALAALENWLNTGTKPDAWFFPESLGFDNSFIPPAWPY